MRKSFYASPLTRSFTQRLQALRVSFNQLSFSPLATFMTFLVIGITLALPMGLWMLLQNVNIINHNLHDSAQISLYLSRNISSSQLNNLQRIIKSDKTIADVTYISPDEGLKEFQHNIRTGSILSQLKKNPLPGVLVIQPQTTIRNQLQLQQLVARLQKLPHVNKAQLDMTWLQRLNAILLLMHRLFFSVMFIFDLGVILIVGNTIRLITQNHRDEINVLQLLGASNPFIRRPFLYSGIIYGFCGSIIAWLLVDLTSWWLTTPVNQLTTLYNSSFQIHGLTLSAIFTLVITGSLLGYIGSWIAVEKNLKATDL